MAGIWGKIIGGAAGFALGGPIGALLGAVAGHAVDRMRAAPDTGDGRAATREIAFTIAVIALCAKMAKADGRVTKDEIAAFRRIFHVPPEEMKNVGRVFDQARKDARGFEPYARQVGDDVRRQPGGAGGAAGCAVLHRQRRRRAPPGRARLSGAGRRDLRLRRDHLPADPGEPRGETKSDPYAVLGVDHDADDETVRAAWLKLTRENHPDRLTAQGMPEDFVQIATERMAAINAAWDTIRKQRGLR